MLTVLASLVFTQCPEDSCAHRSVLPPSCWSPRRPRTRGQTCLRTRAPSPQSSSRHSPPSPRRSSSTTSAQPPPPLRACLAARPRHVRDTSHRHGLLHLPDPLGRAAVARRRSPSRHGVWSDTHCQTRPALRCAREASAAVERRVVARVLTHSERPLSLPDLEGPDLGLHLGLLTPAGGTVWRLALVTMLACFVGRLLALPAAVTPQWVRYSGGAVLGGCTRSCCCLSQTRCGCAARAALRASSSRRPSPTLNTGRAYHTSHGTEPTLGSVL